MYQFAHRSQAIGQIPLVSTAFTIALQLTSPPIKLIAYVSKIVVVILPMETSMLKHVLQYAGTTIGQTTQLIFALTDVLALPICMPTTPLKAVFICVLRELTGQPLQIARPEDA